MQSGALTLVRPGTRTFALQRCHWPDTMRVSSSIIQFDQPARLHADFGVFPRDPV